VRVIAWTFDPLIRRNGYFNLVKLGARPVEYLRNFYGAMDDAINGGTETDRMLMHWDLGSDRVVEACAGQGQAASFAASRYHGAVLALSADAGGAPLSCLPLDGLGLDGPLLDGAVLDGGALDGARTLLVGVPADIEAMRLSDPALAGAWRTALRDVLSPLLGAGARVTGFDRSGGYVVSLGGDVR
jgi:predicted GNAT superfamily acetyltransferase